jgi:adenylylsulfate kinase
MYYLARDQKTDFVICDFVCPTLLMRALFEPQVTIWMDTIKEGQFEDTNKIFTPPIQYQFRIQQKDANKYAESIARKIINGSI